MAIVVYNFQYLSKINSSLMRSNNNDSLITYVHYFSYLLGITRECNKIMSTL